jgi:hypothetical protein
MLLQRIETCAQVSPPRPLSLLSARLTGDHTEKPRVVGDRDVAGFKKQPVAPLGRLAATAKQGLTRLPGELCRPRMSAMRNPVKVTVHVRSWPETCRPRAAVIVPRPLLTPCCLSRFPTPAVQIASSGHPLTTKLGGPTCGHLSGRGQADLATERGLAWVALVALPTRA